MLAYITPEEAQVLKDRGGSGKPHENTGIPSFDETGAFDVEGAPAEVVGTAPGGAFEMEGAPVTPAFQADYGFQAPAPAYPKGEAAIGPAAAAGLLQFPNCPSVLNTN
jgi:hypothetical protein